MTEDQFQVGAKRVRIATNRFAEQPAERKEKQPKGRRSKQAAANKPEVKEENPRSGDLYKRGPYKKRAPAPANLQGATRNAARSAQEEGTPKDKDKDKSAAAEIAQLKVELAAEKKATAALTAQIETLKAMSELAVANAVNNAKANHAEQLLEQFKNGVSQGASLMSGRAGSSNAGSPWSL